jgi:hypothetical protein
MMYTGILQVCVLIQCHDNGDKRELLRIINYDEFH